VGEGHDFTWLLRLWHSLSLPPPPPPTPISPKPNTPFHIPELTYSLPSTALSPSLLLLPLRLLHVRFRPSYSTATASSSSLSTCIARPTTMPLFTSTFDAPLLLLRALSTGTSNSTTNSRTSLVEANPKCDGSFLFFFLFYFSIFSLFFYSLYRFGDFKVL